MINDPGADCLLSKGDTREGGLKDLSLQLEELESNLTHIDNAIGMLVGVLRLPERPTPNTNIRASETEARSVVETLTRHVRYLRYRTEQQYAMLTAIKGEIE